MSIPEKGALDIYKLSKRSPSVGDGECYYEVVSKLLGSPFRCNPRGEAAALLISILMTRSKALGVLRLTFAG